MDSKLEHNSENAVVPFSPPPGIARDCECVERQWQSTIGST